MKRSLFLVLLLFTPFSTLFSQSTALSGTWLLTRAETPQGIQEPWLIFDLTPDGRIILMQMEMGSWSYDAGKQTLIFSSEINPKLTGKYRIVKLDDRTLVTDREGTKLFYTRLDSQAVAAANTGSSLAGLWEVESKEPAFTFLKFSLPDEFTSVRLSGGMTESYAGNWIWDPGAGELILITLDRAFRGRNKLTLRGDKLTLRTPGGETLVATRSREDQNTIEPLTFTEDELPEESDDSSLPAAWKDFDSMVDYLKGIRELHYRLGRPVHETGTIFYTPLLERITVDTQRPSVRFTKYTVAPGDTNQYAEKYKGGLTGMYDLFFPENEIGPFRITGTEEITVPAGTFTCTVVEGMDGDTKVKYWMINDKPGIFARIVRETPDPFGEEPPEIRIRELTDIITL